MLWPDIWAVTAVIFPLSLAAYFYVVCERYPANALLRKRAIITGGSSGIGLQTAHQLVQQGTNVCIIARDQEKLDTAVAALKANNPHNVLISSVSADISQCEAITDAVQQGIVALNGADSSSSSSITATSSLGLDILICCAGITYPHMFDVMPVAAFDQQMQVNYLGTVFTVRAALAALKTAAAANASQHSRIVIVSSLGGLAGVAGYTSYSPTKFALRGFAESLHMETRVQRVLVSLCNPPDVDTPTYTAEQLVKPEECKLISAGVGVFQPQAIAASIVHNLTAYAFLFSTGFDGHVTTLLATGTGPCTSMTQAVTELLLLGPARAMFLVYRYWYNNICVSVYTKAQKAAAEAATAKAAATSTQ